MKTSTRLTQRFFNSFDHESRSLGGPFVPLILLVAFVLRSWDLDLKPPHFDEGINGHFVAQMWKDGFYRYDPTNFHGPLYFYVLQLAETLFGPNIVGYRFVTGLISLGIVAMTAMHRRFVGAAAVWAAAFLAISPAFVFYSRYAIHESLFILLQVVFSYGFFLWREERSRWAVTLMTIGFYGMFAVKETFFIYFGTWLIALGCVAVSLKLKPDGREQADQQRVQASRLSSHAASKSDIVAIVLMGALATVTLFSGFFMNIKGINDMFTALMVWTKTGVGATGHEKPWSYWLQLLRTYEWPFLLGLILSPFVFFAVERRGRLLVLVGIGTLIAYSIIPYKTPWLILNFQWLLAFAIGFAIVDTPLIVSMFKKTARPGERLAVRAVVGLLFAVSVVHSSWTTLRLNFRDYAKDGEPYVYVQSTMQFKRVMDVIATRVRAFPEDLTMKMAVLNKDPWPLPWVLGRFTDLQWGDAQSTEFAGMAVVLIDDTVRDTVESKLQGKYWVMPFQVRGSYGGGFAYLDFERFKGIVPSDTPIFEGAGGKR